MRRSIHRPRPVMQEEPAKIWWLGQVAPPDWLVATVPDLRTGAAAPTDAGLILMPAHDIIDASNALGALPRVPTSIVFLVRNGVEPHGEITLLEQGAAAVIDARSARMARARLLPWIKVARRTSRPSVRRTTAVRIEPKGRRVRSRSDRRIIVRRVARAERRAKSSLRRHHALEVASHLLGTMMDVNETFQRLVEILARELESSRVSLMRVDRENGILEMQAAVGVPSDVMARVRVKIGEGIAGTCARLGKPLFVDDHARIRSGEKDLLDYVPTGDPGSRPPMSLTVPILVKGETVGVVNITDRVGETPYSPADISFASALMAHAGYLLENAALIGNIDGLRGFLERVLDAIEDPLVVVDKTWNIVSGNKAFYERFRAHEGQSLSEAVGADEAQMSKLTAPADPDEDDLVDWVLNDWTFDMSVTHVEGGEAGRKVVLFHDITGRRQMERRLVSAEKMASLGVLSAGVAHEINNPITFVKSNTLHAGEYFQDLLQAFDAWRAAANGEGSVADAEALEASLAIDQIRDDVGLLISETAHGVERVQKIVASLKGFAHPDSSSTREANLPILIENAIVLTQGEWKYRLEIVRDFEEVPSLFCLPTQLEQVFMNLITNAAQAAPEWGKLTVSIRETEKGVRVEFSDDCGGIPAHIVDRIFEPFFTTKDIGKGTGLGLSISYNIIEGHGGQLSVVSEEGQSTTFAVDLPIGVAGRPLVVQQHSRFRA